MRCLSGEALEEEQVRT